MLNIGLEYLTSDALFSNIYTIYYIYIYSTIIQYNYSRSLSVRFLRASLYTSYYFFLKSNISYRPIC